MRDVVLQRVNANESQKRRNRETAPKSVFLSLKRVDGGGFQWIGNIGRNDSKMSEISRPGITYLILHGVFKIFSQPGQKPRAETDTQIPAREIHTERRRAKVVKDSL